MQDFAPTYSSDEMRPPWPLRLFRTVRDYFRPALGWPAYLVILLLAAMPAFTLNDTGWVTIAGYEGTVALAGPLGATVAWLLLGWRRRQLARYAQWGSGVALAILFAGLGLLAVIQITVGLLPSPAMMWAMATDGEWLEPFRYGMGQLARLATRLELWLQGVRAGGAAQDNQVLALLFGTAFWLLAGMGVALARRTRRGLIAALPFVWIVLVQLAYGSLNRGAFIYALLLAILLHLILDHERMTTRWAERGIDFNPGIGWERILIAGVIGAGIMGVAAIFPNVYVAPIAQAYYDYMVPLNEQIEGGMERVAPDAQGLSRARRGGVGGGMPNDFLLQGGPNLRRIEVLRYRTNETFMTDVPFDMPFEEIGPPGHYMRGGTFVEYNGRGWSNPSGLERIPYAVDEPVFDELPLGRRELVQSIVLEGPTQILYAAPELVSASVEFRLEQRGGDDMVAAWSRERSYTVVSAIPAVSEMELRNLPDWSRDEQAALGLEGHLDLPDTVTDRTRALVAEIVAGQTSPYGRAAAIEAFLRAYEYDLNVPVPPGNVRDIADYFLFDEQRGYCDYYATAFVVMARLAGLPARFATGFAAGYWNPGDMSHVVTEADAHSWPEVYFPEIGWVAFEPTAAQPLIPRIGIFSPGTSVSGGGSSGSSVPIPTSDNDREVNWQVWLWLIPGIGLVWLAYRLVAPRLQRATDPWSELLAWGNRLGRPIRTDETPLEYGQNLGDHVAERLRSNQDTGRMVVREMGEMGRDISDARYGPERAKSVASARAEARWSRLRSYRGNVRVNVGQQRG